MQISLFMTGYPGFLASDLLEHIVEMKKDQLAHIYVLVLASEKNKAEIKLKQLQKSHGLEEGQCVIILGDITEEGLGMSDTDRKELQAYVTHVFHLAAIYDLAVEEAVANLVNVQGTQYVNDFVKTLSQLKRYVYFSTAYVSGRREGKIYEDELIMGQSFKNHYERTKYEAEVHVQNMMPHVPITIIRPGIVRGHAKTGKTAKFDGLYFMLNMYDKLRLLPWIPLVKSGDSPEGNFVPSDYLIEATACLSFHQVGEGKVYHVTDPNPLTMKDIQQLLMQRYLGKKPKGTMKVSWMAFALSFAFVRKYLQVEKEALDYFTYQASYDATEARKDLEKVGIHCPSLEASLDAMIDFYEKYKHDTSKQIRIK